MGQAGPGEIGQRASRVHGAGVGIDGVGGICWGVSQLGRGADRIHKGVTGIKEGLAGSGWLTWSGGGGGLGEIRHSLPHPARQGCIFRLPAPRQTSPTCPSSHLNLLVQLPPGTGKLWKNEHQKRLEGCRGGWSTGRVLYMKVGGGNPVA